MAEGLGIDDVRERIERQLDHDEGSRLVCEVGMGLNPGARLVGRMLEDEKALRTAHVAFGSNQGFPGGHVYSGRHMDVLVHLPTISVTRNGETVPVLRGGDLAFEWAGEGEPVVLTGPAVEVFRGVWPG